MKTEAIVAISFFIGNLAGIAIMAWVVFFPLPYWSDSSHFANFSEMHLTDIGATFRCTARAPKPAHNAKNSAPRCSLQPIDRFSTLSASGSALLNRLNLYSAFSA